MSYTSIAKPTSTYTKIAKVIYIAAKFGIGVFGISRFDNISDDTYTSIAKPTSTYTKIAKT